MKSNERKAHINIIKSFSESKEGKEIIKELAPEVFNVIDGNSKILDIAQNKNDISVAGNYEITINGQPLYAGESGNVFIRACEHIYNMYNDENKFGFILPNEHITVRFQITHLGIIDRHTREKIEATAIQTRKHILQYTDPTDAEYGNDKIKYDKIRVPRENIRIDYCVKPVMRKKRVNKILSEKDS